MAMTNFPYCIYIGDDEDHGRPAMMTRIPTDPYYENVDRDENGQAIMDLFVFSPNGSRNVRTAAWRQLTDEEHNAFFKGRTV